MLDLRRRQFLTLLGSAAAAWPVVARAQNVGMRRVIVLMGTADDAEAGIVPSHYRKACKSFAGLTRYLLVRAGDQRRASGGRSRFAFVDSRKLRKISEGCCQGARNGPKVAFR
jgi:hypothetical protein